MFSCFLYELCFCAAVLVEVMIEESFLTVVDNKLPHVLLVDIVINTAFKDWNTLVKRKCA